MGASKELPHFPPETEFSQLTNGSFHFIFIFCLYFVDTSQQHALTHQVDRHLSIIL